MSRNCCTSGALSSVTKPSASGTSSSRRSSRKNCATGNPAGVPGGFWMRYAARSVARNTGCSWPERTRLGTPGRWRAVDEFGAVLDVLLQARRDGHAAQTFFEQLLITYDVPDVIHTDKLRSYGAAIRELPVLHAVEHTQVISAARCNNLIEQSHRPTRKQERSQLGFKKPRRAQEFLALHARVSNLYQHTRTTVPALNRRRNQSKAHLAWRNVVDAAV